MSRTTKQAAERKVSSKRSIFSKKMSKGGNEYFSFYDSKSPRFRLVLEDLDENGEVTAAFNLNGAIFNIEDPAARFEYLVNNNIMTQEEAEEALNKIPDFILEEARVDIKKLDEL